MKCRPRSGTRLVSTSAGGPVDLTGKLYDGGHRAATRVVASHMLVMCSTLQFRMVSQMVCRWPLIVMVHGVDHVADEEQAPAARGSARPSSFLSRIGFLGRIGCNGCLAALVADGDG